jgi:tape measure domain-containing protein
VAQSTVRLIVDAQNAIRPLQRTDQLTKQLSKNTDKLKNRLDKSSRAFKENGTSAKVAAGGVRTLTSSLGPLLKALALAATFRFIFVKTADLQTQRTALVQLTGSVDKANKIISQLQAFGNVTPFTSSELIEQAKRLKAFGFETEDLVDTVKRLSDVAGATGADLSGISTAFGQILAKGKLQREEELQLLERGVDITSELKRITGLQGEEFEQAMRKGKIGADLVNQALINLTSEGGVFFGGATKQSQTLNGQVSTLQDNIETLARIVGETLEPALMGVLKTANRALGAINRLLSSEFQRQISGLRFNLMFKPSIKITDDLKKISGFVNQIQPLGLDVEGIDLRISQLEGTRKNIIDLTNKMSKRISNKEIIQSNLTLKDITEAINNLQKRKNLLLGVTKTKTDQITESLTNNKDEADKLKDTFTQIGNNIATGVSDALVGAIMQTKSLGDAARSILQGIASDLLRLGINTFLSSTFGGIFSNLPTFGGKKAAGGPVSSNRSFLVGEKGPEMFVPSSAGRIIPNNQLGGRNNNVVVNVSVDASGSSVAGNEDDGIQLGRLIAAAVQSEIVQQKRAGGLLA